MRTVWCRRTDTASILCWFSGIRVRNHNLNTYRIQSFQNTYTWNWSEGTLVMPYDVALFCGWELKGDIYRVRQKYMTIWQNSSEWNRWRGEFVLERSSSETHSNSVAMGRWSEEHRAFAVETYLKNNDSVLTQRIFRWQFSIHRNECP